MASHTARLVYTAGIKKLWCILKLHIKKREAGAAQKSSSSGPAAPASCKHDGKATMRADVPVIFLTCKKLCIPTPRHHTKYSPLAESEALQRASEANLHLTECGSATLGEFFSSCPSSIGSPVIRYTLLIITANATTTSRADCCCSFKLDPLGGREHVSGLSSPPTNGVSRIKRERIYRRAGQ